MVKLVFNDRLKIKVFSEGKISEYACSFHDNIVNASKKTAENDAWKTQGFGAEFRGDAAADLARSRAFQDDRSELRSLDFYPDGEKILFSAVVNDVSGILSKDLSNEKGEESHIVHSAKERFSGGKLNADGNKIVTCVSTNEINSHLAIYDLVQNDYMTLTDGDCFDANPSFSSYDGEILFDTKGAGRNADGDFVQYSPSSICSYNVNSNEITEILSYPDRSLSKPFRSQNGDLYFVEKPIAKEKIGIGRTILDVILIPWRLLTALFYFFETFTIAFTGNGFNKNGSNPAKNRDKSDRDIFIEGNLVNAEKEYKNNLKRKEEFAGYAPASWKLIRLSEDGTRSVIANGVIDYALSSDGSVAVTNGKTVYLVLPDGKKTKIADASLCSRVAITDK